MFRSKSALSVSLILAANLGLSACSPSTMYAQRTDVDYGVRAPGSTVTPVSEVPVFSDPAFSAVRDLLERGLESARHAGFVGRDQENFFIIACLFVNRHASEEQVVSERIEGRSLEDIQTELLDRFAQMDERNYVLEARRGAGDVCDPRLTRE